MAYRLQCWTCGYTRVYRYLSQGHYAISLHKCRRHKDLVARRGRITRRKAWRASGEIRECHHKHANHQHGTYAKYVLDRCRCLPCRDANVEYERWRTRLKLQGRWDHWVDAEPVRARLLELTAEGVGYKQVCHITGLAPTTLGTILYGRHDRRGGSFPQWCRREIAEQVMGLVVDPLQMTDGHVISSIGFRRRVQALVAIGWSYTRIAAEFGKDASAVIRMTEGAGVTVRHMKAIIAIYDRWWDQDPVATARTPGERRGVTMARRLAAERNWPKPMDWPDDLIDDPQFRPGRGEEKFIDEIAVDLAVTGHRVRLSKAERELAVQRLTAQGMSAKEIGRQLHVTGRTVVRIRHTQPRSEAA